MAMSDVGNVGLLFQQALDPVWNSFWAGFPGLLAAILILVLGYLIGALVAYLVELLLEKTQVTKTIVHKMDLDKEVRKWNIDHFIGLIVKWYVFLVFVPSAASVVSLPSIQVFLQSIVYWIPKVILALIIVLFGYIIAEYLAHKIRKIRGRSTTLMASVAKLIVWVFITLLALGQIGLNLAVAEGTFLIILSGVMLGLALAFGLGFKDEARGIFKKLMKKL